MLHFRKLSITDRAWAQPFIEAENSRSADYNFGNIYMWDGAFRQHLTSVDGRLLTKLRYEDMPFFAFPIGSGDVKPSIEALTEFAAHRRYPFAIRGITEEHRALLEEAYPGRFRFSRTATASTTSIPSKNSPPLPARSSTASATSATVSRRSTPGSSSA